MIFNAQEVSKYICRRLYRWFVYYQIDSAVETNVIEPLAALLRSSNYEIKPVLNLLLKSEHFFDVLNQGCQIKSPVDKVIGMSREFNIQFQPTSDYVSNYGLWNYYVRSLVICSKTLAIRQMLVDGKLITRSHSFTRYGLILILYQSATSLQTLWLQLVIHSVVKE
jgi:hypothetical protein